MAPEKYAYNTIVLLFSYTITGKLGYLLIPIHNVVVEG